MGGVLLISIDWSSKPDANENLYERPVILYMIMVLAIITDIEKIVSTSHCQIVIRGIILKAPFSVILYMFNN